jgi:hypothetical protein
MSDVSTIETDLRFQEGRISVSSSLLAATMIQKSSLRENRALSHRR